jgi:hypothetical protein
MIIRQRHLDLRVQLCAALVIVGSSPPQELNENRSLVVAQDAQDAQAAQATQAS